ncbi:unnamed protein product, partial [marine sediment metagenome]
HFKYIKAQKGEKIALVDNSNKILGWIGLIPDTDGRGKYFILSGHEVHSDSRGQGIGSRLMEEAQSYLTVLYVSRLKFGTSPLLTINASLYITKFGTCYTWNNKIKLADGSPWPYVTCEWDFNNPLSKPAELTTMDILSINILQWRGYQPIPLEAARYPAKVSVLFPPTTKYELKTAIDRNEGFLKTLFEIFDSLHKKGYGFTWFDKIRIEEGLFYYYYMTKELNILRF